MYVFDDFNFMPGIVRTGEKTVSGNGPPIDKGFRLSARGGICQGARLQEMQNPFHRKEGAQGCNFKDQIGMYLDLKVGPFNQIHKHDVDAGLLCVMGHNSG